MDEEELERELEELEQEEIDKELLDVGPTTTNVLPDVPVDDVVKDKAKEKKKGKLTSICVSFLASMLTPNSVFQSLNRPRIRTSRI